MKQKPQKEPEGVISAFFSGVSIPKPMLEKRIEDDTELTSLIRRLARDEINYYSSQMSGGIITRTIQGEPGPAGPQGPQGPEGPAGEDGADCEWPS